MIILLLTLHAVCLHSVSDVGFTLANPETGPGTKSEDMLLKIVLALESQSHGIQC
jgi:hypothetical protein